MAEIWAIYVIQQRPDSSLNKTEIKSKKKS